MYIPLKTIRIIAYHAGVMLWIVYCYVRYRMHAAQSQGIWLLELTFVALGVLALSLMIGFWHWFSHKYINDGLISFRRCIWLLFTIYLLTWLVILLLAVPAFIQHSYSATHIAMLMFLFIGLMMLGIPVKILIMIWSIALTLIMTFVLVGIAIFISRGYIAHSFDETAITLIWSGSLLTGTIVGIVLILRQQCYCDKSNRLPH